MPELELARKNVAVEIYLVVQGIDERGTGHVKRKHQHRIWRQIGDENGEQTPDVEARLVVHVERRVRVVVIHIRVAHLRDEQRAETLHRNRLANRHFRRRFFDFRSLVGGNCVLRHEYVEKRSLGKLRTRLRKRATCEATNKYKAENAAHQ